MGPRGTWLSFASDTRTLAVLLAGAVIAFVVIFVVLISNASFTERSEAKGNQIAAGEASLQLSTTGPIVNATDLRPGQTRSGEIVVTNTGEPALLSVTPKGIGTAPEVAAAVRLKIAERDSPGSVYFNDTLANAGRVQLGTHGADQAIALRFELSLPAGVDPSVGGKSLNASFEWEAHTP